MTERMVILCLALLVFGIGYNALISYAERQGYLSGFTWTAVVLGVAVTVVGAVARYVGSREEDKRSMRAEALQSWWINE